MTDNLLTLKVTGLGHKITLEVAETATVSDLKQDIHSHVPTLPPTYQRLLCRGKKLDDNEATLSSLNIKNRTSIMLLHNELYAADKEAMEAISLLEQEIHELAATQGEIPKDVLQERITLICCKLDGVDTHGSESLRAMRKEALKKAEALDSSSSTTTNEEEKE